MYRTNPMVILQTCDNALTASAASQCLNQLSAFLGPSILRGRVEQFNPRQVTRSPFWKVQWSTMWLSALIWWLMYWNLFFYHLLNWIFILVAKLACSYTEGFSKILFDHPNVCAVYIFLIRCTSRLQDRRVVDIVYMPLNFDFYFLCITDI